MSDDVYSPPIPRAQVDPAKAAQGIRLFLEGLGLDPNHPELRRTPELVTEAFAQEFLEGYQTNPKDLLRTSQPAPTGDPIYGLGISFVSMCPHHLLPVTGVAYVGFTPGEHIVGISRLAKLVRCLTRRLDLQENLAPAIADALIEELGALGAGCILVARHGCMAHRGVRQENALIMTSAMRRRFQSQPSLAQPLWHAARSSGL